MTQYYDTYPKNPQSRTLSQMMRTLEESRLAAYPVDSCYAFGCVPSNGSGIERIRRIRQLGDRRHFTLVVSEFSQLGAFVEMDNWVFRTVKAAAPGPYTSVLKATHEVLKMMQHPKRHMIGVWIPDHHTTLALLGVVGSPLVSSTLLLPDHPEPLVEGWTTEELLDHGLGTVLDFGDHGLTPTTVVGLSGDESEVVRVGADDPGPFK